MAKEETERIAAYFQKCHDWLDQGAIKVEPRGQRTRVLRRGVKTEDTNGSELTCACGHRPAVVDQATLHISRSVYTESRTVELWECPRCSSRYVIELVSTYTGFP